MPEKDLNNDSPGFPYKITKHALDKCIALTRCKNYSCAEELIRKFFARAHKVHLKPNISALRLINNRRTDGTYAETEYYEFDAYRFAIVVEQAGETLIRTMVTMERKFG